MVSEEQLEFSENGSDRKGLFKVFWRSCLNNIAVKWVWEIQ
jgi:hypothetical protein